MEVLLIRNIICALIYIGAVYIYNKKKEKIISKSSYVLHLIFGFFLLDILTIPYALIMVML